jgi:uncharacterized membrane protein YphA (DoxX/SURF4 family)
MKSLRTGAMFLAFATLVGGYLLHQYFWFNGPEALANWTEQMLPITIALGWVLLILAAGLAFTKPDEEKP